MASDCRRLLRAAPAGGSFNSSAARACALVARVVASQVEALARRVDQPLALVLGQVLHRVLVDTVRHEDDLDVLGEELLDLVEGVGLGLGLG